MNITYFKYFTYIVEEKSISKVAKKEHISQSALSQIVKKLEDYLSCTLLVRSNTGVQVTESGKIVYDYAKSIVSTFDYMKNRLYCIECECYDVLIKPCYTLNSYLASKVLFNLQNEYKNIRLNINADCKKNIISDIENSICDFGLVMGYLESQNDLDIHLLGNESIVLVCGIDYKINPEISLNEINDFDLIEFNLGSYAKEVRKSMAKLLVKNQKFNLKDPTFKIDSISAIKSLLDANLGIAFLPYSSVAEEIKANKLKVIDINGFDIKIPVHLVSQKDQNLNTMILSLKQQLKTNIIKIVSIKK